MVIQPKLSLHLDSELVNIRRDSDFRAFGRTDRLKTARCREIGTPDLIHPDRDRRNMRRGGLVLGESSRNDDLVLSSGEASLDSVDGSIFERDLLHSFGTVP